MGDRVARTRVARRAPQAYTLAFAQSTVATAGMEYMPFPRRGTPCNDSVTWNTNAQTRHRFSINELLINTLPDIRQNVHAKELDLADLHHM